MFVIIGYIVVCASVFGGFAMAGGHLAALFQPLELLMIGGAALGAFFVGNDMKSIKATAAAFPTLFKGSKFTKKLYLDLLAMMFDILTKIRKDGMMAIEKDVEDPEQSTIFTKYPNLLHDHHLIDFICDYLRLMLSGNMDAFQIENLMDNEIETHHNEGHVPVHCIARLGDGLPAFGIVAAVMGVVHTMESIGIPPSELGLLIAHALVGTFLGILLAYGFVGPLSSLCEQKLNESTKIYQTVKVVLLASLNGYAPTIAIEFGRKVLYSTERPSFIELEDHIKQNKSR
ncbi:flagellar motor stator protein MotA [Polynucleobacter aenigmaticus]|uniref:Flagellar motor stator protein MotA n=1 Tax=Polynucleobacter aenigmaticus TaxID=1743164 RepID=A0A254PZE1_9BURK|nr:flagellar motor stator protein MotA [Polynucleobacter aenigmaticus]OWS71895.1 flagellar motor stator protein MotA [Polynucleobacter aenigmaticus]